MKNITLLISCGKLLVLGMGALPLFISCSHWGKSSFIGTDKSPVITPAFLKSCCQTQAPNSTKGTAKGTEKKWSELWKVQDTQGQYYESVAYHLIPNRSQYLVEQTLFEEDLAQYLEKNRTIFKIQSANTSTSYPVLKPIISQQEFWINKERFFNELSFNWKSKKVQIKAQGPEGFKQYQFNLLPENGTTERSYCLLHTLPQCLVALGVMTQLKKFPEKSIPITVIASHYPFSAELFNPSLDGWFSEGMATLVNPEVAASTQENKLKQSYSISVEAFGQVLAIHYDENDRPLELSWVAQGLVKTNSTGQNIQE